MASTIAVFGATRIFQCDHMKYLVYQIPMNTDENLLAQFWALLKKFNKNQV